MPCHTMLSGILLRVRRPHSTPPVMGGFAKGPLSRGKRAPITDQKGPFYQLKDALL